MAMPDRLRALQRVLWPVPATVEEALDQYLAEAFWDEAVAQPPQRAWDRLRSLLERHRIRRQGMWVLDEPLRDPPELLPTLLSAEQFYRARRLLTINQPELHWPIKEHIFDPLFPTFGLLINL